MKRKTLVLSLLIASGTQGQQVPNELSDCKIDLQVNLSQPSRRDCHRVKNAVGDREIILVRTQSDHMPIDTLKGHLEVLIEKKLIFLRPKQKQSAMWTYISLDDYSDPNNFFLFDAQCVSAKLAD